MYDARSKHIQAIRDTLDILEANPELPMPWHSGSSEWRWMIFFPSSPRIAANLVKAFGGKFEKNDPKKSGYDAANLIMKGVNAAGLHIEVIISRNGICEKKVVGTKKQKVIKVIAPERTKEVEEDVDVVEFTCTSLLSLADQAVVDEIEALTA